VFSFRAIKIDNLKQVVFRTEKQHYASLSITAFRLGKFKNSPSGRIRPLGFAQSLTEMSTGNIKIIMFLGSKVRRVRKADNLTAIYKPIV
jgi:hypothetical protein